MRLKCIRLSGFKSFVDPTTVSFPGNMTAVVGPNGCGKSNIIDAVRWVLGESSAKNLRGEAMTDVIFNGSTSRKPVSRASIELVFDNTEGKIPGEYASYAEISVRRQVTREAQSTYYLNGTKCRRRDITDLFLGTGLGPRSYAIIEQGMISRLVEARPDDLRIFIEEAAGISKYKERRRETETRIRHARENLDRLNAEKADLIPADGVLLAPTAVEFTEGESIFDVLKRVCRENKIHMEFSETPVYQSAYIEGIGNLYEFDCGEGSGWMYRVNGEFPNYGCSRYTLADGDTVEWVYTCDFGADVGGGLGA